MSENNKTMASEEEAVVYESDLTVIRRESQVVDGNCCPSSSSSEVIIKSTATPSGSFSELSNEYNILTKSLGSCRRVRSALKMGKINGRHSVVLEWVEGCTLTDWIQMHPPLLRTAEDWRSDLLDKIQLSVCLADALAEVHEAGVIHNDINTNNVIVTRTPPPPAPTPTATTAAAAAAATTAAGAGAGAGGGGGGGAGFDVKLIDFGYAERWHQCETEDSGNVVNEDLFALGLVLHEIFEENFEGASAAWDIASQQALPVETVSPGAASASTSGSFSRRSSSLRLMDGPMGLPRSLATLLSNLSERDSPDRYDTVRDIHHDLDQMLHYPDWFLFDPKPDDLMGQLYFDPRQIYGRSQTLSTLFHTFNRVISPEGGKSELVLLSGAAGTGKSTLVQQIKRPLSKQAGYFVSGRFDPLVRASPYSAFIAAFTDLCDLILAQDEDTLHDVATRLQQALGTRAKLLTDLIPRLTHLIGDHQEAANVGSLESQNQFNSLFRSFVRALSSTKHPIVLFLDDMHWADDASMNLLKMLSTDTQSNGLLFIVSYRSNEVNDLHLLTHHLREIARCNVPITHIEVTNLSVDDVNDLVSTSLRLSGRLTKSLTSIIYRKTHGNVFFVKQFLRTLCDEGLLCFSAKDMRWRWDEAAVHAKNLSDNVVELMASKMTRLSRDAQGVLKIAGAVGSSFDEDILRLAISTGVLQEGPELTTDDKPHNGTLDQILASLIYEGLIDKLVGSARYKFAHDRIQQAAYTLIPERKRARLHLEIGRLMYTDKKRMEIDRMLFVAVDQLNRGATKIKNPLERIDLARLNLKAGKRAILSSAFISAAAYFKAGISVLPKDHWQSQYNLSLELFCKLADAEYCNGHFFRMEGVIEKICQFGRTFEDKFPAYCSLMKASGVNGNTHEAFNIGLDMLAQLGETFPEEIDKKSVLLDFVKTKMALVGKTDETLASLPRMENSTKVAAMKVLSDMFAHAVIGRQDYIPLVANRMVRLTLTHGASTESAFGFACYAMMLCGPVGDIKNGGRYGRLALSLLERFDCKEWFAHVTAIVNVAVTHWHEPLHLTLQPFLSSYRIGMEVGDLEYAMYSLWDWCNHAFLSGKNLTTVAQDMKSYALQMTEYGHYAVRSNLLTIWQCVLNLMGRSDDPLSLTGEAMNQQEFIKESKENTMALSLMHVCRLMLAFTFREYELAATLAEKTRDVIHIFPGYAMVWVQAFYDGMTAFALAGKTGKKKWMVHGKNVKKKLKQWARYCPETFLSKFFLLRAEHYAAKGESMAALKSFDAAIVTAGRNGFIHEEALGYERAGLFLFKIGDTNGAARYFARAHHLYMEWGALAKANPPDRELGHRVAAARRRNSFQMFVASRS